MNFRRSDFDVTNRINTTDPVCVKLEVARIYRSLYHVESQALNRAFDDTREVKGDPICGIGGFQSTQLRFETKLGALQQALESFGEQDFVQSMSQTHRGARRDDG